MIATLTVLEATRRCNGPGGASWEKNMDEANEPLQPQGAQVRLPRRFSAFHDAARRLPSPPSEARRDPSPEGFQAAEGRFPRAAGFSAGWSSACGLTRVLLAGTTALGLAACSMLTSPTPAPSKPAAPEVAVHAMKLAQAEAADFVFCHACPATTAKTLYLVVDATSDDPAARALARIREALRKRGGGAARLEQIDRSSDDTAAGVPAWMLYAVVGDPMDKDLARQLGDLVRAHPRSKFRIFGTTAMSRDMQQLATALQRAGLPRKQMGSHLLQRDHVPDEILQARPKGAGGSGIDPGPTDGSTKLLVTEPIARRVDTVR